jgi:UDP-N-acetylmuramoyl-L-alanyl-D-glutamate--2,6-diaminopimelate ligase
MLLRTLLTAFQKQIKLEDVPNLPIAGVCEDSRRIRPGELFVARAGTKTDGARFLADAKARGAVAAVVQNPISDCSLPQIVVPDVNQAASILANAFFDRPDRAVRVLGITGTNGKTTTTYLLRHLLGKVGVRCGMVGTVEIDDGTSQCEAEMTTPSATQIAQLLAGMRDNGCRACAMEVSSHALDQGRTAGVRFAGAAFTNLTGDHLDYHKTMDQYAAAKAKLFASLDQSAVAAVNDDDPYTPRMIEDCGARILRFGFNESADYRAMMPAITAAGTHFILRTPDGQTEVSMKLIGRHNIENALAAATLAGEVFGLTVHQIASGLRDALGAPGRLQPVLCGQPFAVLVDYAHTDDALENVLTALRPLTRGKLRVLFGCGGDRDRTKRPRMARCAEKFADVVYVTSDNPRTENPAAIIDEIVTGLTRSKPAMVELDRHKAIERILGDARDGDVVLLAGKGHENYQIVGTEKRHFDDAEEARAFLASVYGSAAAVNSSEPGE